MQVPPFREGKHRAWLYAGHRFGALPRPPAPEGEKGTYMQRIKKSEIITLRVTPRVTLADAICDRIIYNACTIQIEGESMRKRKGIPE